MSSGKSKAMPAAREKNIVCPLYHSASTGTDFRIRCEGLYARSNIIQRFSKRADFEKHMQYCQGFCYRYCEIYRAVASAKGYSEEE